MKSFYQKGITILEIIIVIAVVAIMAMVAFPQLAKMKQTQILKNSCEDIISASNKAKSETLASLNSYNYGIHFQSDKVIIFRGTTYVSNDSNNETISITSPASISTITLSGGGTDFYFNRLSGAPTKSGSVVVSIAGDANLTKTITISATGSLSIN